jgi:hypothetical protein
MGRPNLLGCAALKAARTSWATQNNPSLRGSLDKNARDFSCEAATKQSIPGEQVEDYFVPEVNRDKRRTLAMTSSNK